MDGPANRSWTDRSLDDLLSLEQELDRKLKHDSHNGM